MYLCNGHFSSFQLNGPQENSDLILLLDEVGVLQVKLLIFKTFQRSVYKWLAFFLEK